MRSRDGNKTLLLSIFTIIFSLPSLVADEFLISYRYVVIDATMYNETLQVASSMKKCLGKPINKPFILEKSAQPSTLKKAILEQKEDFLHYLHTLDIHIQSQSKTTNAQNRHSTILTLKTTCFKVDFNDTFATMTPLK